MIAKAGFYHAGQVCVSVQRVYAPADLSEEVAQRLAELGNDMLVDDPVLEETDIGPLIRPREVSRVDEWVQQAVSDGAELLSGGKPVSDTCYPATVLLDPPDTTTISCNEVFGPVICVYSYEDIDEAIRRANSLPYAFQAAVYTSNIDTALHVYRHLNASAVMINDHTAFRVDWMPFAGLKHSGHGVGGIRYSYEDMTIEKMAVIRSKAI